jgi:flagellar assembly protein FliH
MSSSTDVRRLRGAESSRAAGLAVPELSPGTWTRLGDAAVRGDEVTEHLLGGLADRARTAAQAQGYATGWAQGRREALAALDREAEMAAARVAEAQQRNAAESTAAAAALRAAADRLDDAVDRACRAVEERATTLALELTRELVGEAAATAGEHAVRRVAALVTEHPVVTVRLHPSAAELAGDELPREVSVVADPELGPADAVVEADDHVIDLRVETALQRLRAVLA